MPHIFILLGVSGSGKTSLGRSLANQLGWSFFDADDYHPSANIHKMSSGIPLTDADRQPWLERLNALLKAQNQAVLACSALKESYRQTMVNGLDDVAWVYLKGSYNTIYQRLNAREGHFMTSSLLQSQFDALEEPNNAQIVDITEPLEELCQQIVWYWGLEEKK